MAKKFIVRRKSKYPKEFPCPVCKMPCEVGLTKKQKPYLVCNFCGVQVFVRGKTGVQLFKEMGQKLSDKSPKPSNNSEKTTDGEE